MLRDETVQCEKMGKQNKNGNSPRTDDQHVDRQRVSFVIIIKSEEATKTTQALQRLWQDGEKNLVAASVFKATSKEAKKKRGAPEKDLPDGLDARPEGGRLTPTGGTTGQSIKSQARRIRLAIPPTSIAASSGDGAHAGDVVAAVPQNNGGLLTDQSPHPVGGTCVVKMFTYMTQANTVGDHAGTPAKPLQKNSRLGNHGMWQFMKTTAYNDAFDAGFVAHVTTDDLKVAWKHTDGGLATRRLFE